MPAQPVSTDAYNPTADFSFAVELGSKQVAWFTECTSITLEREATPHPEGGVNNYVHQLPGPVKHMEITLSRGVADKEFWDWLQKGLYDVKVEKRNVSVILFDSKKQEATRWNLPEAYPVQWTGPTLKTDSNQVAIETLQLGYGAKDGGGHVVQTALDKPTDTATATRDIDKYVLADKVYRLMRRDLDVERERGGY